MNKYFILLFGTFSLFVSLGLISEVNADRNQPAFTLPTATPDSSPEINDVVFDKETAFTWCPYPEEMPSNPCSKDMSVNIKTIVKNSDKTKNLTYYYTVSGGRIIGQGANVTWDFKDTRPGKYTIIVGISSTNNVQEKTVTKTFEFRECPVCDLPCVCPTLDVFGGGQIKAGEEVIFTADLKGGTGTDFTYQWKVSLGEIVKGQGTPEIKVKTTSMMRGTITAAVEIGGPGLCATCPTLVGSETATVIK